MKVLTRPLLLVLTVSMLLSGSGCLFWKKNKKTQEGAPLDSNVEADFRQRWIDRRVAELTAQGTESGAARQAAENEFRERYAYLNDRK